MKLPLAIVEADLRRAAALAAASGFGTADEEACQRFKGIVPPISLYELRHTFVSIIEDAISPAEMRRIVGHSKSMDTYGSYSHAVAGRADKVALAVSETLAEYAPSREK